jgi:hypothetical protein
MAGWLAWMALRAGGIPGGEHVTLQDMPNVAALYLQAVWGALTKQRWIEGGDTGSVGGSSGISFPAVKVRGMCWL